MKVLFYPIAVQDIASQVAFFLDEFAYDAAERFPAAVDAAAQFVMRQPDAGVPSRAGLRAWAVPGFPKVRIYYHCPASEWLHIVRVLHTARDVDSTLDSE